MEQLIRLTQHVTINDLVDILIVSLIIYNILVIIKGTRAVQMLVGLSAICILFAISHNYQLYSLNWVLTLFFDSFFIIFIILFQDQIRSALVNFGNTKIFGKNKKTDFDPIVEEIVETCAALSREKLGGLIVVERQNGLMNYAQTGTILNANIHSDILYSIFQTVSPLHDGAVIIAQNRLQAAGCFLPLSKNVEIDRHLGTRHRAALGVSEVSDAVVVIVSEETGKIKLCFNGIFYNIEDENSLRRQIKKLLLLEGVFASSRREK